MKVGILGYGVYLPKYRVKVSDIASVWGKNSAEIEKLLGLKEKSVSSFDEDAVTQAFEAASISLKHANVSASELEVCLVGSESHPYAVNPTSTIVAEFLGVGQNYLASDLQFACKAATSGIIATFGLIACGKINIGLVIGSDKAQAKTHDILEYTSSSAAASYVLGNNLNESIMQIVDFASFSSDTPDFWRRDGVRFPSHGGRFTGEPAYFAHVMGAAKNLLEKTKLQPSDFSYCVFHMPNGKFPKEVAKRLGFTSQQLAPSLIFEEVGNPYSASSLLGLCAVLDIAKPGQLIFMVSYGSGAGSDSFVFKTLEALDKKRKSNQPFSRLASHKKNISYIDYLKYGRKI
ncbi:hypothetical protein A2960_06345 [Candidatus Gottesmanbacteria bacterium RIFCSPLOWO2_01_FULL_39_12b]|uniref:Beta-ketoacyl-[acyl-carrier-protein] synthase III C-terminal domain-containing protein n=1 Tax=Candidatus Gottesmanbacteria bacterium RIFCSPLOWO2_01_FULL_39_12b TaxID=1798388 RepID=A0A1F6AP59_9BACT|nr:MAG: hypothetical protein A2960_06345 [Candidatus Gottesmanbacteria bacterium RIFCSPLOWO2_01_FULL_39_12b]